MRSQPANDATTATQDRARAAWILAAALYGLLGVLADAAASHLLGFDARSVTELNAGAQYGIYHAIVLLALAAHLGAGGNRFERRLLAMTGWLFVIGTAAFSGSLYLAALTGIRSIAWVAPLGGTCLILGWVTLIAYGWQRLRSR